MIGVFDSGVGGLTVARAVMERLPEHDIVYFGDTARTPYGAKSPQTVTAYALEDVRFLIDRGAKLIVVACNTVSSVAADALAAEFDLPLFEVIAPAVETALSVSRKNRFGIIGTRATVASGEYERRIRERRPDAAVHSEPCPLLVPLVEEGWINRPETTRIVKKYLIPLKARQIDTLILGCTHYPVLLDTIARKAGKRVRVVDSANALAQSLAAYLSDHPQLDFHMSRTGQHRFFVSDLTDQVARTAKAILRRNVGLEAARG
jgi:glutamate racemase